MDTLQKIIEIYIQLVNECPGWLGILIIFERLFRRMGDVCEERKEIIVEMKNEMDEKWLN